MWIVGRYLKKVEDSKCIKSRIKGAEISIKKPEASLTLTPNDVK